MKLLEPDLYTEASCLLFRKLEGESYRKMRKNVKRLEGGKELAFLFDACEQMEDAVGPIAVSEPSLHIKLSANRSVADCLWHAYYRMGEKRKPSEYMPEEITKDGGLKFLRLALGSGDDTDTKDAEEVKRQLLLSDIPPDVKYRLLEICMAPEEAVGVLCSLVEQIADITAPFLAQCRAAYRGAELFFSAPEVVERLSERVHIRASESVEVLPMLLGLNKAFILDREAEKQGSRLFFVGLLFFYLNVFDGKKELSPEELSQKLRCFTDETKLKILLILKEGSSYQAAMAKKLGLSAATVSHHLDYLANNGIVSDEIRENRIYYHLEQEGIGFLADGLKRLFVESGDTGQE